MALSPCFPRRHVPPGREVPQFNNLQRRAGREQCPVGRERDRRDRMSMSGERENSVAARDVPQRNRGVASTGSKQGPVPGKRHGLDGAGHRQQRPGAGRGCVVHPYANPAGNGKVLTIRRKRYGSVACANASESEARDDAIRHMPRVSIPLHRGYCGCADTHCSEEHGLALGNRRRRNTHDAGFRVGAEGERQFGPSVRVGRHILDQVPPAQPGLALGNAELDRLVR